MSQNTGMQVYGGASLPPSEEMQDMWKVAQALVTTRFLPAAIDTPAKAVAIALKGRELGLPFMLAMSSIHIIEGKPTASSELMRALAFQRIKGFGMKVIQADERACSIEFRREGSEPFTYTYRIEDAQRSGDSRKNTYSKYPGPMLVARCTAQGLRLYCPDATMGVYAPEEFDEGAREPAPAPAAAAALSESVATVVPNDPPPVAAKAEAPTYGTRIEGAQEIPASGASTKAEAEPERVLKVEMARFKAAMTEFARMAFADKERASQYSPFLGAGAGERLVKNVNAIASACGLPINPISDPRVLSADQWASLALAAEQYVTEKKAAGSGMDAAAREDAPVSAAPDSGRWQDNVSPDADAEIDAAARGAMDASTPDEAAAADSRLEEAKRRAKGEAQRKIYASASGLVAACERAAKKFSKTRPDKVYLSQVGDTTYFVDGDVMDACGIPGDVGINIDTMTEEQRATIRRAVEAEVEAL